MPTLLMIGCGWMGRPYLERAHRLDLSVAIVDAEATFTWPETAAALGPNDRCYPVSSVSTEHLLAAASQAITDERPVGVLGFSEQHVVAAAIIADRLRLPGPGLRAAITSRNKLMQRQLVAERGLLQPEYIAAASADVAADWAKDRYPVVLKPLDGMGSLNVEVVADEEALRIWVRQRDLGSIFLVEQCLSGPEFSIEAIISAGELIAFNVTEKETTDGSHRVEMGHVVPALLPESDLEAAQRLALGVIAAFDIDSGIIHTEFILTAEGPCFIETAVRTPGDYLLDVIAAATGHDLYESVIRSLCGLAPSDIEPGGKGVTGCAAIDFITAAPGVVREVIGVEQVMDWECVVELEINVEAGGTIHPIRSSLDRPGMVIVRVDNRSELAAARNQVLQTLCVHTVTDCSSVPA